MHQSRTWRALPRRSAEGGGAALTKRALERAAELGLPWSDKLSPDTMREVADALLLAIKDEDDAPGPKPR